MFAVVDDVVVVVGGVPVVVVVMEAPKDIGREELSKDVVGVLLVMVF